MGSTVNSMTPFRSRGRRRRQRTINAQAVLELVILLPPLLVVASAVLHFGMLYYVLLSLQSAACTASLYAASYPQDSTAILNAINTSLPAIIDKSSVHRTVLFPDGRGFGKVGTIRLDYDVAFLRSMPFGAFIAAPTSVSAVLTFPVIAN